MKRFVMQALEELWGFAWRLTLIFGVALTVGHVVEKLGFYI